jgi:hypothetical protein
MPFVFPENETFDVGIDTRTPIETRTIKCRSVSRASSPG